MTTTEVTEMITYSPTALAQLANMAPQSILRYLKDDQNPKKVKDRNGQKWFPNAFRVGSRWHIPENDVTRFLGYDPNKVKVNFVK